MPQTEEVEGSPSFLAVLANTDAPAVFAFVFLLAVLA
jgi:hypothetical protein